MVTFILESLVASFMSYAILMAIFDSHLFSSYRGIVHRLKQYAEDTHNHVVYSITYLLSCYMCSSYWVCWFTSALVFLMHRNFIKPCPIDYLVIFSMGLVAETFLQLLNHWIPSTYEEEDFTFFPWNHKDSEE